MTSADAQSALDVGVAARWEYLILTFQRAQVRAAMNKLNQAGAIGWEAVSTSQGDDASDIVVLLKRPLT